MLPFLISVLAIWRVCHFIAYDSGPHNLMGELRNAMFRNSLEVYQWATCVSCSSVWFSLPVAILVFGNHVVLYWLALSAGAMIVEAAYAVLWKNS